MQVRPARLRASVAAAPWTAVEGRRHRPGRDHVLSRRSPWNGPCTRSAAVAVLARIGLVALLASASGCDGGDDDEIASTVAERTADAVAAKTKLALIGQVFDVARGLGDLDAEAAAPVAIAGLRQNLEPLVKQGCVTTLESDDRSYVHAVFDGCVVRFLRLDGDIRMELAFETASCATGECVSAAVWSTDDFALAFGPRLPGRPELAGPMQLRAPTAGDAAMAWTTEAEFTVSNLFGTFASPSRARWSVDAMGCVEMDLVARIERVDEPEARRRRRIGTMVAEVAGLRRCPRACPEAGHVWLSFGQGTLLEWDYGTDEVEVAGPRGVRFAQALDCE